LKKVIRYLKPTQYMEFPLGLLTRQRSTLFGAKLRYQGCEYRVVWPGVLTSKRKVQIKHVSILKRVGARGCNPRDFVFCSLCRCRSKLSACKLPVGSKSPFSERRFPLAQLKQNIVWVVSREFNYKQKLPCYPLRLFTDEVPRPGRHLFNVQAGHPPYRGWCHVDATCGELTRSKVVDRGLEATLPKRLHRWMRPLL
jgi:hypothetical protein